MAVNDRKFRPPVDIFISVLSSPTSTASHLNFWLEQCFIKRWPSKTWADSLQPFCVLRKGQDGRIVEVESQASPVSSIEPDFIPSSWAPGPYLFSHLAGCSCQVCNDYRSESKKSNTWSHTVSLSTTQFSALRNDQLITYQSGRISLVKTLSATWLQ